MVGGGNVHLQVSQVVLMARRFLSLIFWHLYFYCDINAVFPPTTTASTTSVLSSKNPNEHGWLGWDLYFKDINETVTMFNNTIKDTETKISEKSISEEKYPYESIVKKIGNKVNSISLFPFKGTLYDGIEDMVDKIESICKNDTNNFIYAYYDEPDHTMHLTGTDSEETKRMFETINNQTEKLCNRLKNALVIVIADHGHINSTPIIIKEHKEIYELLERTTSIEPRACSFKIKEGYEDKFEKLFNNKFGDYFILLNKDEVKNKKIFGTGNNNNYFDDVIGDFIAIAKSNKHIYYDENGKNYLSMHAGITEDEVIIPLIIYES